MYATSHSQNPADINNGKKEHETIFKLHIYGTDKLS